MRRFRGRAGTGAGTRQTPTFAAMRGSTPDQRPFAEGSEDGLAPDRGPTARPKLAPPVGRDPNVVPERSTKYGE